MKKLLTTAAGLAAMAILAGCAAQTEPPADSATAGALAVAAPVQFTPVSWSPLPFDDRIAGILEANIDLLLTDPQAVPLPEGYNVMNGRTHALAVGDLSGARAIAAGVERHGGVEPWDRLLFVLTAEGAGGYQVRWQDDGHLGGRGAGGMWGDSFAGIAIENGALTVSVFGGSSDRWGQNTSYVISDNRLILSRLEFFNFSIHTASGTRSIYYPSTGVLETRSLCDLCEEFDNLLLAEGRAEPALIFEFADSLPSIWGLAIPSGRLYPRLPSLHRQLFGSPANENLQTQPSQALDMAQAAVFPNMARSPMPHSRQILDNFSAILGYEVPSHFFLGDGLFMAYLGQNHPFDPFFGDGVFHIIQVYDLATGSGRRQILVNDATGEVTER
ncbi:MAG: hypothetical protein FWG66_07645 [Spirochaetes bacterium]|nr:hypothetical protein [Spirochaetota bacterium]